MKFLILITISILSLNVFSAELGEDQKGQCPFLDQSSRKEIKVVDSDEVETVKDATKVISK
jgi:hypothetical protein